MGAHRGRIWKADLVAVELAWRTWLCPRAHIAQHFGTTEPTLKRMAKEKGWPPRKRTGRQRPWAAGELLRLQRVLGSCTRRDVAARFHVSVSGLRAVVRRYNLNLSGGHSPQSPAGDQHPPPVLAGPPVPPMAGGPRDLRQ